MNLNNKISDDGHLITNIQEHNLKFNKIFKYCTSIEFLVLPYYFPYSNRNIVRTRIVLFSVLELYYFPYSNRTFLRNRTVLFFVLEPYYFQYYFPYLNRTFFPYSNRNFFHTRNRTFFSTFFPYSNRTF